MILVKYNPLAGFAAKSKSLGLAMNCCDPMERSEAGSYCPRMDMIKEGESFKIMLELPGMEKENIKTIVEDSILTISGERKQADEKESQLIRSERLLGRFSRSFRLPNTIDRSGVSADYKNGLLTVTLPVKAEAKPRQIDVQIS
jgi:HSP20 family protein